MAARRFCQDDRGGTAIEFALIAPVLIFILFATLEMGIMGMMSAGLDNAVTRAARMIRTGQADGPTDAASFESLVCGSLGATTVDCRGNLQVSVQRFSRFSDAIASADAPPDGTFNKGEAGDIVVVRATYRWPLITPQLAPNAQRTGPMEVTLDARTAFKNEPFE